MAQQTIPMHPYRQRKNIRELEEAYLAGDKKPLCDLLRAWKGIQELDPKDPNSFFVIGGYHGEPFRGAGWGNPQWWGGYCNHGNVLFPTWHRAYLWRLENALRSIPGCENVALPYWDETDGETLTKGLPTIFTCQTFQLDTGETIKNPLYSYTFQEPVWDNLTFPPIVPDSGDNVYNANPNYYKYPGYQTVRYPFSGLTSESDNEQKEIDAYNASLKKLSPEELTKLLNENIQYWLIDNQHGTYDKYKKCLTAPNYTVFSNTTSAMEWNERNLNVQNWGEQSQPRKTSPEAIVPLESPHNDMHLAVGGFNYPGLGNADTRDNKYALANGDMGENETASFDPIFFFHHCFVDKIFWDWQNNNHATKKFDIIEGYPGTNSVDNQGPTPGVPGGTWLTLKSPLNPFKKGDNPDGPPMTSEVSSLHTITEHIWQAE
jgi:tyrosinase